MPRFEFATASRIVFGAGTAAQAGSIAREWGRRALVVTGSQPERARPLLDSLKAAGVSAKVHPIAGEPATLAVAAGVARARLEGFEMVIGIGGGSAIDGAKAIAGLLTNDQDLFDYLEVIGRGLPMRRPAAPWMAIPTTAGAGAEVTRNAVLTSREHKVKASLRSPHLLARVALVDPELTRSLPPPVTAATGLDALTQLIEPFVSPRANPLVDSLCVDGLPRIARSLRRACEQGDLLDARTDLSLAALFGGLALANAGLGAVHGLASPVGGSHAAPHGAVCAALLPAVMDINLRALRERAPEAPALDRYRRVATLLTGQSDARPEDGVAWVRHLVRDLSIPNLRTYGLETTEFPALAARAAAASSMKANPVTLTDAELQAVLGAAW